MQQERKRNYNTGMLFEFTYFLSTFMLVYAALENSENITVGASPSEVWFQGNLTQHPEVYKGGPLVVTFQIYLHSLNSFSEANMEYSVTLYLRQTWTNVGLVSTNRSEVLHQLDQNELKHIWKPDIHFVNEKKGGQCCEDSQKKLYHIYGDGSVLFTVRYELRLSCNMDLHKYPLDMQKCPIIIESYSQTTDKIVFRWIKSDQLKKEKSLTMAQFTWHKYETRDCTRQYDNFGNYTCIMAEIYIRRDISYYFVWIYVPSILIVILSWLSFWLNIDATPARISLGVLTVLSLTTQASGLQSSLPKVSYVKALDVWLAICMMFVFGGLIEYAFVNVFSRGSHLLTDFRTLNKASLRHAKASKRSNSEVASSEEVAAGRLKAQRLDGVSRFAFPLSFMMFNVVYWSYYSLV